MRRRGNSRSVGLIIAVALGGAATACSVVFGFDGFQGEEISGQAGTADGQAPQGSGDGGASAPTGDESTPEPVVPFVGVPCASATASGVCLPPVPDGWEGPVILFEGAIDAGVPSCPGAALPVAKGLAGLVADDATCAPCTCGLGSSPSCSSPTIVPDSFPFGCSGSPTTVDPGQCVTLGGSFSFGSSVAVEGASPSGACTGTGGQATVPPSSWSASAEACKAVEVTTATCPSGQTCREGPPAGFVAGKYCVYSDGDYSCPRGVYSDRHEIDDGPLSDDRGCRACDCDAKGGQCDTSALQVAFFASSNCSGDAGKSLSVPATCQSTGAGTAHSARLNQAATLTTPPTCSVRQGSGTPRGSARTNKSWTVCCTN